MDKMTRPLDPRLRWAALLLAACLALGIIVSLGLSKEADRAVLKLLALRQGVSAGSVISLFQWISWSGEAGQRTLLSVAAALWLVWQRRPRAGLVMLVVPALTGVTSSILKQIFARPRPDLVPHLDHVSNLSYPSGHASNAIALCLLAALLIADKRRSLAINIALAAALAIGSSRMMLGVHYPSDVIGGWLWGAGLALIGLVIVRKWEAR
jgi:undecaprenyl-diphosphatase